jgi:hypothetical protein
MRKRFNLWIQSENIKTLLKKIKSREYKKKFKEFDCVKLSIRKNSLFYDQNLLPLIALNI